MKNLIVVIEDDYQNYARIDNAIKNYFIDKYIIPEFTEIDELISDLSNCLNPNDKNKFISILKVWCNNLLKENNILAFVIDINLFNSYDTTGLSLKNLIKEKQIFIGNEEMSLNIPIFIISGIEDKDIIDAVDDNHVVNQFIPKGGTGIETRLMKILDKSIGDYIKIITPKTIVKGNYIENNYNGELIRND